MKNITMSKNALPKELADNYNVQEKLDIIALDTTDDTKDDHSTVSEYEEIKQMLNILLKECEKSYEKRAKKELYDFIISLKMAKGINL